MPTTSFPQNATLKPCPPYSSDPAHLTALTPPTGRDIIMPLSRILKLQLLCNLGVTMQLTGNGTDELVPGVDLEVVLEVRLAEEDPIAILVGAGELFGAFVGLHVLGELLRTAERLLAALQ